MDPTESQLRVAIDRGRFTRRRLLQLIGWSGLTLMAASALPALARFFRPRGAGSGGDRVELGALSSYRTPGVNTRWTERHGVWMVTDNGRLFALEARCTHLGCTPRWMAARGMFRCPCHGSRFSRDGDVLRGPATEPLWRFAIRVDRDQVVVDRSLRAPGDQADNDPRYFVHV